MADQLQDVEVGLKWNVVPRLAIIGHAQEKFTPETERTARQVIREAIERLKPTTIVSGRSPMGGVDAWAEEIAAELGLETKILAPKKNRWDGPGGFKERNLAIARNSDLVLVVVVRDYPPDFKGVRFELCYHCVRNGKTDLHVKSGACWTAWKAKNKAWLTIGDQEKEPT